MKVLLRITMKKSNILYFVILCFFVKDSNTKHVIKSIGKLHNANLEQILAPPPHPTPPFCNVELDNLLTLLIQLNVKFFKADAKSTPS